MASNRMSPKAQESNRNAQEKSIAMIANPAKRDSALAAYNVAKGRAKAANKLASYSAQTPRKASVLDAVTRPWNMLMNALGGK